MTDFWAKTGSGPAFLSVERHLADAGAVAARLWDEVLTPSQRAWLAAALGLDADDARAWLIFLVASHDIGKISSTFQGLVPELRDRLLPENLLRDGREAERLRHDQLSGAILRAWLLEQGCDTRAGSRLSACISGHHGELRSDDDLGHAERRALVRMPRWRPHQHRQLDALKRSLGLSGRPWPSPTTAGTMALVGFVTVADWLASDARHFPVEDGTRPPSSRLAIEAVRPAAWRAPDSPEPADSDIEAFGRLFPDGQGRPRAPRATQRAVIEATAERAVGRLLIVEDRTGSGKTEAALWAVRQALAFGARGLFVGMPTRATADQLHTRASGFLARLWPDRAVRPHLLHGMALALGESVPPADVCPVGVASDPEPGRLGREPDVEAQAWFASSKRGLLAPFVVGTIDQALLATMWVRHGAVRLWALQGKVVVFDECHAYDTYTGLLLKRLVAWLGALDCTIVLLSATLPEARRLALAEAFQEGRHGERQRTVPAAVSRRPRRHRRPGLAPSAASGAGLTPGYPRITIVDDAGVEVRAVDDDRSPRTFALGALAADGEAADAAIADRLLDAVATGGCVGVVCNTVGAAQARYAALRERVATDDVELLLLHARQRPVERAAIERRLLAALGPPSSPDVVRPARMIVVATQIVEQSLDVDFDLLLTDLAPVDLLIQRAGRVHRHDRPRPVGFERPCLEIVDSPGRAADREILASSDHIYQRSVLQRTRLALRGRDAITEPADLDPLIEAVYGPAPPAATPEELAALEAATRRDESKHREQQAAAGGQHGVLLPGPASGRAPWNDATRLVPEPDEPWRGGKGSSAYASVASTRWQERPSISVVVLREDELPDARQRPDRAATTELLQRAVSLSQPAVVRPVLREWGRLRGERRMQPVAWRTSAALRHHALVELDGDGNARAVQTPDEIVRLPLRLDPDLGVIVEENR